MGYKTDHKIKGFFEYVVPPLEGFWCQDDADGVDYSLKIKSHIYSFLHRFRVGNQPRIIFSASS